MDNNYLTLKRFCGEEKYPVESANWYIIEGDGTWDDPYMLCLEMEFSEGEELHEDTENLEAEPSWEISFSSLKLTEEDLKAGFKMELENEDDEDSLFYYCEHQPTFENKMEILEVKGDSLLIHITGKTTDVNFYDGSKPMNELDIIVWFEKEDD